MLPRVKQEFTPEFLGIQFVGVVKGVEYLHSRNIAHGDIKAVSPLVFSKDSIMKIILFLAEHPHFGHFSGPSHARGLWFNPHHELGETNHRRNGDDALLGSRTPSPDQVRS